MHFGSSLGVSTEALRLEKRNVWKHSRVGGNFFSRREFDLVSGLSLVDGVVTTGNCMRAETPDRETTTQWIQNLVKMLDDHPK